MLTASAVINDSTIDELQICCEALLSGSVSVDDVHECETLKTEKDHIQQYKDQFSTLSRLAAFWVQCIKYINLITSIFIRAEIIGDWNLHITTAGKEYLQLLVTTAMLNSHVVLASDAQPAQDISVATIIMTSSSNMITILLDDQQIMGWNMNRFFHRGNYDAYYQIPWWSHSSPWHD